MASKAVDVYMKLVGTLIGIIYFVDIVNFI